MKEKFVHFNAIVGRQWASLAVCQVSRANIFRLFYHWVFLIIKTTTDGPSNATCKSLSEGSEQRVKRYQRLNICQCSWAQVFLLRDKIVVKIQVFFGLMQIS